MASLSVTPAGSGLPFGTGNRPIRPITGRPSLSPASSTPWPISLPCGRATTQRAGAVGLTQLIGIEMRRGEAGLYNPVEHAGAAVGRTRSDGPFHVAFWLRPVSLFGRFGVTSPVSLHFRSAFHVSPSRAPPRGWQSRRPCPRSFTPWVDPQHVRVGAPWHQRVRPGSRPAGTRFPTLETSSVAVCSKRRMLLVALLSLRQSIRGEHSLLACERAKIPKPRAFEYKALHCGTPAETRNSLSPADFLQSSGLRHFSTDFVSG